MKLGSLFDGSGGFPLAGAMCGIEPVWASEVEPYPIAVTKSRFPNMKHLGNVCKINGAEIEPVDIITFGSPCQDLSVAGKRAGLKHKDNGNDETTRSGLFMEAVRIIKEMREATNGRYPTYAVWENVPGAFSSNSGEDFRTVLEELIRIAEPSAVMPDVPKGGWAYADWYMGDGWSIAYRVLDAQYWGVPQRRRRIYLVLDLGGERAGKILFEREGLRGYFAEGRTPWQGTAEDAQRCVGADDREGEGFDGYNGDLTGTVSATLGVNCGVSTGRNGVIVKHGVFNESGHGYWMPGFGCLRAEGENRPSRPSMCIVEAAGFKELNSARARSDGYGYEVAPCLASNKHDASVCYTLEPGIAAREGGHIYEEVSGTLRANAGDNQMAVAYIEQRGTGGLDAVKVYGIDHAITTGGNCTAQGPCVYEDIQATLKASGPHAVAYTLKVRSGCEGGGKGALIQKDKSATLATNNDQYLFQPLGINGDVAGTLDANYYKGCGMRQGTEREVVAYPQQAYDKFIEDEIGTTLKACGGSYGGGSETLICEQNPVRYIVRRLTPTECARLQGFHDKWGHPNQKDDFTDEEYRFWLDARNTHAAINGKATKEYTKDQVLTWYNKLHTDGAEYKMWGNGIALPTALYVMQGIAETEVQNDG